MLRCNADADMSSTQVKRCRATCRSDSRAHEDLHVQSQFREPESCSKFTAEREGGRQRMSASCQTGSRFGDAGFLWHAGQRVGGCASPSKAERTGAAPWSEVGHPPGAVAAGLTVFSPTLCPCFLQIIPGRLSEPRTGQPIPLLPSALR